MNRMKPLDVPHKGLRNALSQLLFAAGKTNYDAHQEIEALHILGTDVFTLLTIHSEDEDSVTLTELESRSPGSTHQNTKQHQELHLAQINLEKQLNNLFTGSESGNDMTGEGAEFYLSLSEFYGDYLRHIAEEERIIHPLLWQHFTDEELAAQRVKILGKNPPLTLLTWFKYVIPAQNHKERLGLLSGFKRMATPDFFTQGMDVIRLAVPPSEFDQLQVELEN